MLLLLVLILNNSEMTVFNFYGLFTLKAPLFLMLCISLILGVCVGLLVNVRRNIHNHAEIKALNKALAKLSIEYKNSTL